MSEYIPKYPSEEGDDSNKTSSELLAETLKPIYVPQDLMLAWETHLASYSRDTYVLLDQVKESESNLNNKYQALLSRVQKYEQMLQDITMDSNEFTMDTDVVNFTGWNILAQASYWDYLLRKEITKLRDQIKSAEFKGELVSDVSDSVLENLSKGNEHISNIIGALTDSPLIRDLDAALSGTSTSLSTLRKEHEKLKAKQYADAIALAEQNGETFDRLTLTFNDLISEQIDRIADEAATRTRLIQELEDGITTESQLRYEGQEAIATQVLAIKTSTETAVAGILQDYSTIAGTNEAITTALNTYSAQVDGTIATILTDYVSYANLDYVLTSKTDKLMSIINSNVAQLTVTNEITASLNKVRAINTLTVDINGVVSGYGLISSLENGVVQSAFGVNADTFYIGKPSDKVKPFVVTTIPKNIDGIDFPAGTWINSAIIANATIGTAHIKDAAITNAKIGSLDASKITTGTLNAARITVGPTTTFDTGYNPKLAKDSADAAYSLANTANNTANYANSSASTANSQLALWKYPNSTYIDGGKIYTNSITANKINVTDLSAISANLGTIKVDSAHIGELAVGTNNIKINSVTEFNSISISKTNLTDQSKTVFNETLYFSAANTGSAYVLISVTIIGGISSSSSYRTRLKLLSTLVESNPDDWMFIDDTMSSVGITAVHVLSAVKPINVGTTNIPVGVQITMHGIGLSAFGSRGYTIKGTLLKGYR